MDIKKIRENQLVIERIEQMLQAGYESNEQFNDSLNGQEPFVMKSLKDPENEYRFEVSEILFWVDRNAYIDELDHWDGNQAIDRHIEAIQYLKDTDQVSTFLDLVEAIRRRRVAPFIGAGFSVSCGYPQWGDALKRLVRKLEGVDVGNVHDLIEQHDYLGAAQILFEASPELVKNYIKTEFRLKPGHDGQPAINGPVTLLPKIAHGCIVTTNLDEVIEQVFKNIREPLDGYMHGVQPGNNFVPRLLRGDRCILKLHGDALQENSYVFTAGQYSEAYGQPISFDRQLPRALRQIFISYSLIFLGCSLEQDRTLDLFQQVVTEGAFEIPDHFAILPRLGSVGERAGKTDRLLSMKIQPLWYEPDDTHSFVEKLILLATAVAERQIVFR